MSNDYVDIGVDELIQAIRHDCVALFSFYMGADLSMEVPAVHEEIWAELLQMVQEVNETKTHIVLRKLFAVPREFAKTTVAKFAVILFLKYTRLKFVLYVSKTNGHAKNAIRDIIGFLSSPQEVAVFGNMLPIKSSETESLWILDIPLRDFSGQPPVYKRVIFKALGSDQQVRGLNVNNVRPQIIILDDIEDNDNTTKELQPKLDEWVLGALIKAFDSTQNVCIFIGNMIRKTTLLARFSKDPSWNPTVFGCLVRDRDTNELRSLWEERHPKEKLLKEYASYRRLGLSHVWEAEMMNLTQDEILVRGFENALRIPEPSPESVNSGIIILDPAFGMADMNDDSAITVHVRINNLSVPAVVDKIVGKFTEEELFDKLLELSYKWGITTWGIETEAAQKLFIPYFKLLVRDRKMNESLFTFLPLQSGGKAKASRILAFSNSVSSGSYAVVDSEFDLIENLSSYDPNTTKHDDLCDSAAYGLIAWQFYGQTIVNAGIKQVAMLAFRKEDEAETAYQHESYVAAF